MTVERIGPPDPVSNLKKTHKTQAPRVKGDLDSINVSQEAKSKAEVHMAMESAKLAPDVRVDKVEEIKRKLQDPAYPTQEAIESAADGIMKSFGLS
jgi:negative regulator of flagellin synthesis FlgM